MNMELYKIVHPVRYYRDCLANNVRPDGRKIDKFRNVAVNKNQLSTCNGSSVIRIGNTCVVCGIKGELGPPKAEAPENGFMVINVELPPLCSSQVRPGPPSDKARVLNALVTQMASSSKMIDMKSLCIEKDKLVWTLYCDIYCVNYDGAVIDACFASLVAALSTVTLPTVVTNSDTGAIQVMEEQKMSLELLHRPIAISFAIVDEETILIDPCDEEENICSGSLIIFIDGNDICGIKKFGGASLNEEQMKSCFKDAKERAAMFYELLDKAN